MKAKISVKYDFDNQEPYIQFDLENVDESNDIVDDTIKNLILRGKDNGLRIYFPNGSSSSAQIRINAPGAQYESGLTKGERKENTGSGYTHS